MISFKAFEKSVLSGAPENEVLQRFYDVLANKTSRTFYMYLVPRLFQKKYFHVLKDMYDKCSPTPARTSYLTFDNMFKAFRGYPQYSSRRS